MNHKHTPLPDIALSLAKRIKRRVTARRQSFFAMTPPGFETLCLEEINALAIADADALVVPGGVSFSGHLHDCYAVNLHSRIAGRILMRMATFKATGFGVLEKKLSQIPWELYLRPGTLPKISVTAHRSRLYHKGAVAERVLDSIKKRLGEGGGHQGPAPGIFIRIVSDRFTLSIDSSGELLYKRGIKTFGGKAPLRETLAAAILKIIGFSPGDLLLDPMCGTGSFAVEGAMMTLNIPPGWYRDFAFMTWPAFRSQRWAHLRDTALSQIKGPDKPAVFASDQDEKACRMLSQGLAAHGLAPTVTVSRIDFFGITPRMIATIAAHAGPGQKKCIVLNPPYGRRLGSESDATTLYLRIKEKLATDFIGWHFALIGPNRVLEKGFSFPHQCVELLHGGLTLQLWTGRVDL